MGRIWVEMEIQWDASLGGAGGDLGVMLMCAQRKTEVQLVVSDHHEGRQIFKRKRGQSRFSNRAKKDHADPSLSVAALVTLAKSHQSSGVEMVFAVVRFCTVAIEMRNQWPSRNSATRSHQEAPQMRS